MDFGFFLWFMDFPETHLEPSQLSKMELFAKVVKGFQAITIFAKGSILDI